jgi:hypothetical protein
VIKYISSESRLLNLLLSVSSSTVCRLLSTSRSFNKCMCLGNCVNMNDRCRGGRGKRICECVCAYCTCVHSWNETMSPYINVSIQRTAMLTILEHSYLCSTNQHHHNMTGFPLSTRTCMDMRVCRRMYVVQCRRVNDTCSWGSSCMNALLFSCHSRLFILANG